MSGSTWRVDEIEKAINENLSRQDGLIGSFAPASEATHIATHTRGAGTSPGRSISPPLAAVSSPQRPGSTSPEALRDREVAPIALSPVSRASGNGGGGGGGGADTDYSREATTTAQRRHVTHTEQRYERQQQFMQRHGAVSVAESRFLGVSSGGGVSGGGGGGSGGGVGHGSGMMAAGSVRLDRSVSSPQRATDRSTLVSTLAAERDREWRDAQQIARLAKELAAVTESRESLREELSSLRVEVADLRTALADARAERDERASEAARASEGAQSLRAAADEAASRTAAETRTLRAEIEAVRAEVARATSDRDAVAADLAAAERARDAARADLRSAVRARDEAHSELAGLREAAGNARELRAALADAEAARDAARSELEVTRADLIRARTESGSTSEHLSRAQAELEASNEALERLRGECGAARSDAEAARAAADRTGREVERLRGSQRSEAERADALERAGRVAGRAIVTEVAAIARRADEEAAAAASAASAASVAGDGLPASRSSSPAPFAASSAAAGTGAAMSVSFSSMSMLDGSAQLADPATVAAALDAFPGVRAVLTDLGEQFLARCRELRRERHRCAQLEAQLTDSRHASSGLETAVTRASSELSRARADLERRAREQESLSEEVTRQRTLIYEARAEVETRTEDLRRVSEDRESLARRAEGLATEAADLASELERTLADRADGHRRIERLDADLESARNELRATRTDLGTVTSDLAETRAELEARDQELESLRAGLAAAEARGGSLSTRTSELEASLTRARSEGAEVARLRDETVTELRRVSSDRDAVATRATSLAGEVDRLGHALDDAERRCAAREADLRAARDRGAALEGDLDTCLAFIAQLEISISAAVDDDDAAGRRSASSTPAGSPARVGGATTTVLTTTSVSTTVQHLTSSSFANFESVRRRISDRAGRLIASRDSFRHEAREARSHATSLESRCANLSRAVQVAAEDESRSRRDAAERDTELASARREAARRLAALQFVCRAFSATHRRYNEVLAQKRYLAAEAQRRVALLSAISALREETAAPRDAGRPRGRLTRPTSLRAAAIAVIAARRLWSFLGVAPADRVVTVVQAGVVTALQLDEASPLGGTGGAADGRTDPVGHGVALPALDANVTRAAKFGDGPGAARSDAAVARAIVHGVLHNARSPGGSAVHLRVPSFLDVGARGTSSLSSSSSSSSSSSAIYRGAAAPPPAGSSWRLPRRPWSLTNAAAMGREGLAAARDSIRELSESRVMHVAQAEASHTTVVQLRETNTILERERDSVSRERDELHAALRHARTELSELRIERDSLSSAAEEMRTYRATLTSERDELERRIQRMHTEQESEVREAIGHMRILKDKCDKLSRALLEAEAKIRSKDATIQSLESQFNEVRDALTRHHEDKRRLVHQEKVLLGEIREMEGEFSIVENGINSLL